MTLSIKERDRRYRAIRTMMEKKDLSILVVTSTTTWPGHGRYFSEYFPHAGFSYVIFPREGDPTQFVHSRIQEQVASTKWITDTRFGSYYPDIVARRIKELDYKNKKIGLGGVDNLCYKAYAQFQKDLPSATFVDVTRDILDLRKIKSEEEQVLARQCARITDQLFRRVKEVARVGISEFDIYAEMDYFLKKQKVEGSFNLISSGLFPVAPFIAPSERVLGPADSVMLELTPRYQGYYTQLAVVHPVQGPSPRMKEFLNIAFEAQTAGLNVLKAGNRASDVARAMKKVIEKAGYTMPYRGGHALGLDVSELPAITEEDDNILSPGMIIVVHPCVLDKNGEGVFIGDTYLTTDTGWERLNTTFSQ
jgi:Xaa-Pro aminopeptidase